MLPAAIRDRRRAWRPWLREPRGSACGRRRIPAREHAAGPAIAASVDWVANFALIEVFPVWQTGIGLGWIMVCFAVTCLLAIAFIHRFLPETKNHSVEEVVQIFEREAEGGHGASGPLARGAAAA